MRLFIAVEFPEPVLSALDDAAQTLRENSAHGTFTRRENHHVTLVFIGETDRVKAVRSAMHSVTAQPFTLRVRGSGKFRRTGGDIYWIGLEANETLQAIHDTLSQALRQAGFKIEARSFTPHITLGREVVLKNKEYVPEFTPMDVKVDAITLMRSDRINGKLTYTPVYRVKLKE